ncbi:MAG: hypothetical protein ACE5NP_02895 [Anaerolineae bacterium]
MMDLGEATQLLTWLDEEHRQDKARLAEMEKVLNEQKRQALGLVKRLEELEERLTHTQAQLTRFAQLEDALKQTKTEVAITIKQAQEQWRQEETEAVRVYQTDLKNLTTALSRLQKDEAQRKRALESLEAQRKRLDQGLASLQQKAAEQGDQLEKVPMQLSSLEKRFEQETQRTGKLGQKVAELSKQVEDQYPRLSYLEEWGERSAQQIAELKRFEDELKQGQAQAAEARRLTEERWKRQMDEWAQEMEKQRKQMEIWANHHRSSVELHKKLDKTLNDLQKMRRQLKQDRRQFLHLQETWDERQRQQFEEWGGKYDKRWTKQLRELQQENEERDKRQSGLSTRVKTLEEGTQNLSQRLMIMWRFQEERAHDGITKMEQLLKEMGELLAEQQKRVAKTGASKRTKETGEWES